MRGGMISPRMEDAVPIVMGRLLGTIVGVAGLVFGCGSSALGQDASMPISGAIQVSSNNGKTVTVVTVDRPVLGQEDGLPEYAFIIVEPTDTLADTIEQGEIRWALWLVQPRVRWSVIGWQRRLAVRCWRLRGGSHLRSSVRRAT